jgi:hypothetical protein
MPAVHHFPIDSQCRRLLDVDQKGEFSVLLHGPKMWEQQPDDQVEDQPQHEPIPEGPRINKTLWSKVKRPTTLPLGEICRACFRFGFHELRIQLQESLNRQEDKQENGREIMSNNEG